MTPEEHRTAQEVFLAALDVPLDERGSFLASADLQPAIERAVSAWILAHTEAPATFLGEPAFLLLGAPRAADDPSRLGPYRLLEQIGDGGMGTVYRAVRDDDEYQSQVAIKVLQAGQADQVEQRFRIERQILASLDHPNIARLYDGGTTVDGRPYIVMEYVGGEPINEYCDHQRLSVTERLRLFRVVCQAVHFAHQKLVVHRDVKPHNILVSRQGEPKLLDFGIAKLLDPTILDQPLEQTRLGSSLLSPEYGSPEQVRAEPISTATDVYSLGVVLYQLLTGHRPYGEGSTLPELLRAICDSEPERPSSLVLCSPRADEIGARRKSSSEQVGRSLRGDLDNILSKSLRKSPLDRYSSVDQLSQDIRRHLEGEPVLARDATLAYRASKFVRRHRRATAAAALAVAALTTLTVSSLRDRQRAEREATTSQAVSTFLIDSLGQANPLDGVGKDLTVLEMLKLAEPMIDQKFGSDPEVRAALHEIIGTTYVSLGSYRLAERPLQRSLELRGQFLDLGDPELAKSHYNLGALMQHTGRYLEAEEHLSRAVAVLREAGTDRQGVQIAALSRYGRVLKDLGRAEESEAVALEAFERAASSSDVGLRLMTTTYYADLVADRGDLDRAVDIYRDAVRLSLEANGGESAQLAEYEAFLGSLLVRKGELEEAEEHLVRALELDTRFFGPAGPGVVRELGYLGNLEVARENWAAALDYYRRALPLALEVHGERYHVTRRLRAAIKRCLTEQGSLSQAEAILVSEP